MVLTFMAKLDSQIAQTEPRMRNRAYLRFCKALAASLFTLELALLPTSVEAAPVTTTPPYLSDSDGDGVLDSNDPAPLDGAISSYSDLDGDGTADIYDPDPLDDHVFANSPLGIDLNGPYSIAAGDTLNLVFTVTNDPPGGVGFLYFDLDGDGAFDDAYLVDFISSSVANNTSIAASLFVSPFWDLNTPGVYGFRVLAVGPAGSGTAASFDSAAVSVSAIPLPPALPLFAGGLGLLGWLGRRKRSAQTG
jgi:hypothetical protein